MQWQEGSRRRAVAVVVAAVSGLVLVPMTASAQLLPPVGGSPPSTTSTSTTTTTAPRSTTTTTMRPLFPPASTTTTTTAPGTTTTTEPAPAGGGDAGAGPTGKGPMPPQLQAMIDSVVRTPANNTKRLVAALAPLAQYGLDETQRAIVGFGRFPVAGTATWSDDWWFPRFGPGWRLHEGLDIFAPHGTPVRAPVDGKIRVATNGLGGLALDDIQPDRTYWYMAHLSGLAPGITDGVTVRTGQVIAYVGNSGDARGGPSHLHFEIHPKGGPAVPPKPVIDRFVADALAMAPQVLEAYAKAYAPGQAPTIAPAPEPVLQTLTPRAALLWASALDPTGGTWRLVETDARAAADRIDWAAVVAEQAERAEADRLAAMWVAPLVPRALAVAAGLSP